MAAINGGSRAAPTFANVIGSLRIRDLLRGLPRLAGFVPVWHHETSSAFNRQVRGQRFNASGAKLGSEFSQGSIFEDLVTPDVACAANGNFVVVGQANAAAGNTNIFTVRYDHNGTQLSPRVLINTSTISSGYQQAPAVCSADDGSFVVVWQSENQDGSGYGIFGERFDSAGNAVGTEFQVNTYTASHQHSPGICCSPAGAFVVVWQSAGQDGDGYGVFGQRFGSDGAPLGAEFQINTSSAGDQFAPKAACDALGVAGPTAPSPPARAICVQHLHHCPGAPETGLSNPH
jgi:hypothetical protein